MTMEQTTTTEPETTEELATVSQNEGVASAESTDGEAESEEGAESGTEPKEEDYEQKVTRLAQAIAAKTTLTLEKQRNEFREKVTELENQLTDKVWDRHLQTLFNDDVDNLGEDDAKIKQTDRQKVAEQVKEFRLKNAQVLKLEAELNEKLPKLGIIERDQKAKNDLWTLIFPEDKGKIDQISSLLKKFERAKDWDDYDLILEGIRETVKGKRKPFVPDSSQAGGGGSHLSDSPEDKVTRALEKLRKK